MTSKKRIAKTACLYSALATLGFVVANLFVVPQLRLQSETTVSASEIAASAAFGWFFCFIFFYLVFTVAGRFTRDSDDD
ncbi:MAG: hypothetical protein AAF351_04500 [Pseudomonadota bacterium]